MNERRWTDASDRWAKLLLQLYPADSRDEMGEAVLEAHRDRCQSAVRRGGVPALLLVWVGALGDSLRNRVVERIQPGVGGPDVTALQAAGGAIEAVVGLRRDRVTLTRGGGGEPAETNVMISTANLFDVLGVVAGGLALDALVSCYVPARRVTGIEPARAFREA